MTISIRGYAVQIDKADRKIAEHPSWFPTKSEDRVYFTRTLPGRKTVLLHRIIAKVSDEGEIDHKNGNTLDCRKNNLRSCTHSQNQMNRRRTKNNHTGFKGVTFRRGLWRATICFQGKHHELGTFHSAIEASEAYRKAAILLAGEYARWRD